MKTSDQKSKVLSLTAEAVSTGCVDHADGLGHIYTHPAKVYNPLLPEKSSALDFQATLWVRSLPPPIVLWICEKIPRLSLLALPLLCLAGLVRC